MAQQGLASLVAKATRLEQLLRDGALGEARRLLDETVVAETADPHPEAVSINGGLAWLFSRISDASGDAACRTKAIGYGQAALLLDPDDALALAVLPDYATELVAHNLLRHRKERTARRLLGRLRTPSARQLMALLDFVASEKREIDAMTPRRHGGAPPLLINVIVWGQAYLDALFTYGFASLLAPGNLPAVAADREIIFDVYTVEADRQRIDTHPVTEAVKRFAKFRYNIIPQTLLAADLDDAARWCAGAVQQCSALRAQRLDADLMYLCGSGVYSAEALSRAYALVAGGAGIVACVMPRTHETHSYVSLGRYARTEAGTLACDAPALAQFIAENLHAHSRDCFIGAGAKTVTQNPVALFFRSEDGFVCRTYQPSPLIISNQMLDSVFEVDYFTIDVRFIAELLGDTGAADRIYAVTDSDDGIVVTDVDCGDGPGMRQYDDITLSSENCAKGAAYTATGHGDLAYFRWALTQRFAFKCPGKNKFLPQNGSDELATVQEVFGHLDRESTIAQARIAAFERLPD